MLLYEIFVTKYYILIQLSYAEWGASPNCADYACLYFLEI